jgi:hypothetical protein
MSPVVIPFFVQRIVIYIIDINNIVQVIVFHQLLAIVNDRSRIFLKQKKCDTAIGAVAVIILKLEKIIFHKQVGIFRTSNIITTNLFIHKLKPFFKFK